MSEMVDRVAEVIFLASGRAMDVAWKDADKVLTILNTNGSQKVSDHFRRQARAAIEAMYALTLEMEDAGQALISAGHVDQVLTDSAEVWEVMIDAALSEDGAASPPQRSGEEDRK